MPRCCTLLWAHLSLSLTLACVRSCWRIDMVREKGAEHCTVDDMVSSVSPFARGAMRLGVRVAVLSLVMTLQKPFRTTFAATSSSGFSNLCVPLLHRPPAQPRHLRRERRWSLRVLYTNSLILAQTHAHTHTHTHTHTRTSSTSTQSPRLRSFPQLSSCRRSTHPQSPPTLHTRR
jgi:hypothetical protein